MREKVSDVHPLDNLSSLPEFVANAVGANLAAIFSLDDSLGWVLAAVLAVAVVVAVARDPRGSAWILAALAMVLVH